MSPKNKSTKRLAKPKTNITSNRVVLRKPKNSTPTTHTYTITKHLDSILQKINRAGPGEIDTLPEADKKEWLSYLFATITAGLTPQQMLTSHDKWLHDIQGNSMIDDETIAEFMREAQQTKNMDDLIQLIMDTFTLDELAKIELS